MAKDLSKVPKIKKEDRLKAKACKYQFYKIGADGLLVFGADLIDKNVLTPPEGYTDVPPNEGLYHPKWDAATSDWIEGGSMHVPDVIPPRIPSKAELIAEITDLKAQLASVVTENSLKPAKVPKAPKGV